MALEATRRRVRQGQLYQRLVQLPGSPLLRATSLLVAGDLTGKVLAFVFYVVLAHLVTPVEYGIFRFSLTLGYLGSVLAAAFALTLMHYLAGQAQPRASGPLAAVAFLSLVGTAVGMFAALGAASYGTTAVLGTACVILGLAFSYTFQACAKGTQQFGKASTYLVVSNTVQLIPVFASALWFPHYVLAVAMASYGLSYFVTLVPLEHIKPVPFKLGLRGWHRADLLASLRFSAPLIISQGTYQALFGLDLIWLQLFAPGEIVGYYAAAKALATGYTVIPNALYGVLMPKTSAEGGAAHARHNLKLALALAAIANGGLIVLFALIGPFLLNRLFGSGYGQAALALVVLGIGMLFYALCLVLNAHATGSGAPKVQGTTMLCGLIAALAVGPFLTSHYAMLGASASFAFGTFVALMVVSLWTWRALRPVRSLP